MPERRHVAIVMSFRFSHEKDIFAGISRYVTDHNEWEIELPFSVYRGLKIRPRSWRVDGIIQTMPFDLEVKHILTAHGQDRLLRPLNLPKVGVCGHHGDFAHPHVMLDDVEIGRTAARYFLDRGFTNCAFLGGFGAQRWSLQRGDGFCKAVGEAGGRCWRLERDIPKEAGCLHVWRRMTSHWLGLLPKPMGLLAANDLLAYHMLAICSEIGIRVPEDVAVVGVDNDDVLTGLSVPTLSSVEPGFEQAGYEAAALLDKLMAGKRVEHTQIVIPPVGVVARRSSDILALPDLEVGEAVRQIQEQAHEPITVSDLVNAGHISRRSLERRFRKLLGRSVHDEINRVRLAKVKRMLASTSMDVVDVAIQSGFANHQALCRVFRGAFGMTPTEYRRRFHHQASR